MVAVWRCHSCCIKTVSFLYQQSSSNKIDLVFKVCDLVFHACLLQYVHVACRSSRVLCTFWCLTSHTLVVRCVHEFLVLKSNAQRKVARKVSGSVRTWVFDAAQVWAVCLLHVEYYRCEKQALHLVNLLHFSFNSSQIICLFTAKARKKNFLWGDRDERWSFKIWEWTQIKIYFQII